MTPSASVYCSQKARSQYVGVLIAVSVARNLGEAQKLHFSRSSLSLVKASQPLRQDFISRVCSSTLAWAKV